MVLIVWDGLFIGKSHYRMYNCVRMCVRACVYVCAFTRARALLAVTAIVSGKPTAEHAKNI